MKNYLLLNLLLFMFNISYSQEIPAKANTIVIAMPDSNNLNKKIMDVLAHNGYTIKSTSKVSSVTSTEPKTLKNTRLTLNATTKGREVFLKGQIFIAGQESLNLEYKGNKGTPIMNAWEEMEKVAKAMGGKLRYEIIK